MITFANGLELPCLLYTVTRVDGDIEHITSASTDITIDATTWTAHPGLVAGLKTSRLDGTPPTMGFQVQLQSSTPMKFSDLVNGQYDGARVQIYIASQSDPQTPDLVFDGLVMGEVAYTQHGIASFDLISLFAPARGVLIEKFSIMCRYDFGSFFANGLCTMAIFPQDTFPYSGEVVLTRTRGGEINGALRNTGGIVGHWYRYRFGSDGTPEDFNNVILRATTGGVTAASEPAFSSTPGDLTADGTQIWLTENAYARAARIASVDRHTVTLDRLPDPRAASDSTWFQPMKFVFRTGEYTNRAFKGNNWDTGSLSFETYLPCPLAAVGDWIEIAPDCDKTHSMCSGKFANAHNHGGFPFQIGAKAQAQQLGYAP